MNRGEERASDGLIHEFRIERVRWLRNYVAGFIPEDDSSSLRVVEVVRSLCSKPVKGASSAKVQDTSFGGVPIVICLDIDHMEEEVQDRVQ